MKIKTFKLCAFALVAFLFAGCNMSEMFKKSDDIQKVVSDNCSCELARLINYSQQNLTESAYFEIIGSDVPSKKDLALKINQLLKKQVKGYCDIDNFTLNFINKGQSEVYTFSECELETNE